MLHNAKHCDSIYGYSLQIAYLRQGLLVVGKGRSGCESTAYCFLVVGMGLWLWCYHLFKPKLISEWFFDENAMMAAIRFKWSAALDNLATHSLP